MDIDQAIERVLQGESLRSVAVASREDLLRSMGLEPDEVDESRGGVFDKQVAVFMRRLCRRLGERCEGDQRALAALRDWVMSVSDYDAWDALLTHFDFEGKAGLVERGRVLFAGPMTAHWEP